MYQALFNPGNGDGTMNKTDVISHGAYVLMEIRNTQANCQVLAARPDQ